MVGDVSGAELVAAYFVAGQLNDAKAALASVTAPAEREAWGTAIAAAGVQANVRIAGVPAYPRAPSTPPPPPQPPRAGSSLLQAVVALVELLLYESRSPNGASTTSLGELGRCLSALGWTVAYAAVLQYVDPDRVCGALSQRGDAVSAREVRYVRHIWDEAALEWLAWSFTCQGETHAAQVCRNVLMSPLVSSGALSQGKSSGRLKSLLLPQLLMHLRWQSRDGTE